MTLSLFVAAIAITSALLRLLTPMGALAGFAVGVAVHTVGDWTLTAALLTFFVVVSLATKVARRFEVQEAEFTVDGYEVVEEEEEEAADALDAAADDSRNGRTAWQVLAVGIVPALLCVLGADVHAPLRTSVGIVTPLFIATHYKTLFFAAVATCCADSLASEVGVLSSTPPLLLRNLMPVKRGTDGAISFTGTIASLLGGALIGAVASADAAERRTILDGAVKYALIGALGALVDSALGCAVQPAPLMKRLGGAAWKTRNMLVNLVSVLVTVAGVAAYEHACAQGGGVALVAGAVAALVMLLLVVFLSPMSGFWARKLVHFSTAVLVSVVGTAGDNAYVNASSAVSAVAALVVLAHSKLSPLAPFWGRFQSETAPEDRDAAAGGAHDDDGHDLFGEEAWALEEEEEDLDPEGIGEYAAQNASFAETFDVERYEEVSVFYSPPPFFLRILLTLI